MAGRGSRFATAGYQDPKPFINVFGKTMIEIVVQNLKPKTKHRFIFICQKEHLEVYDVENKLKSISQNCEIIALDGITEGAASTVLFAQEFIDDDSPLMIANSDQYIDFDVNKYLQQIKLRKLDGLIMTMKSSDPKWSFVKVDDAEQVQEVREKEVISDEATVGIYNFAQGHDFVNAAREMIDRNIRTNNEFYVAPTYNTLISHGAKIGIYNVGEERIGMYGLGTPEDLNYFLEIKKPIFQ